MAVQKNINGNPFKTESSGLQVKYCLGPKQYSPRSSPNLHPSTQAQPALLRTSLDQPPRP